MTRKQMQRVVNMMNNDTATEKQIENLKHYADVVYKYNEEENKYMYMIVATYSYSF